MAVKRVGLLVSLLAGGTAIAAPVKPRPVTKPSIAAPQPVFTFKNARAGETTDPNAVGRCSPSDDGIAGKLECRGSDNSVAGVQLLLAPSYYFYNGRLTSMLYLYDNNGVNYLTFLSAFTERYGPPCKTDSEKWQNKAGSTFDNATATWCFKTGKLKLEQLGPSLKYGIVTYDDDYKAPMKETPKDF
jgi:hypothetical protein